MTSFEIKLEKIVEINNISLEEYKKGLESCFDFD